MAPSDDSGSGDPRESSVHRESDERGARCVDDTEHIYVVRAPHRSWWTDDYEHAYQLATGTTSERGGDDHPREQDIRVMHTGGDR